MRPDAASLRTWGLAVFAGWAVLVCVLAGLGMGSRLPPPPAAQGGRPLPVIPPAGPQRLGDLQTYAAIAQRPVFAEDRQPHPFVLGGTGGEQVSGLRLTGVLMTPQLQMATLTTDQGRSIRLRLQGDAVDGWRLLSLAARSATVDGPGGTRTLQMQVFDGRGGEPPTVLRGANGAAAVPPPPGVPPAPAPVPVAVPMQAAANTANPAPRPPVATPPAPTTPQAGSPATPAPTAEQLQAIRERIEARRRALQQQQNTQRNGDGAVQQNP